MRALRLFASPPLGDLREQPLVAVLHPGRRTVPLLLSGVVALTLWGLAVWRAGMPLWGATTLALAVVAPIAALKWWDDLQRWGAPVAVLSVLLAMQGFHTLEHAVQWFQYHVLKWPPFLASGLISAANSEPIHFAWNWFVLVLIGFLWRRGMRGGWAWLLLLWALAHSLEHTYLLVRYFQAAAELQRLGIADPGLVQGLPGVLGRDGWLAWSGICGRVPGLTTATRIDVHFWWNAGEVTLLGLAAHPFLRNVFNRRTEAHP